MKKKSKRRSRLSDDQLLACFFALCDDWFLSECEPSCRAGHFLMDDQNCVMFLACMAEAEIRLGGAEKARQILEAI